MRLMQPWLVLFLGALLAACAAEPPAPAEPPGPPPPPDIPPAFVATHQAVLRCADLAPFGVQHNDEALRIETPRRAIELARTRADAGVKYEAEGHLLWFRAGTAVFQRPGDAEPVPCALYPVTNPWDGARLRGVAFRAIGAEPGWLFEFVPGKWLLLVSDYGEQRVLLPHQAPSKVGADTRWQGQSADGRKLEVLGQPGACSDGMSEESYDVVVRVTLDGETYKGCGRWLDAVAAPKEPAK